MKNVLLPVDILQDLMSVHIQATGDTEALKRIKVWLKEKEASMSRNEAFTRYKSGSTPEEREKARQEYLDLQGIPKDFRR